MKTVEVAKKLKMNPHKLRVMLRKLGRKTTKAHPHYELRASDIAAIKKAA